MTESPWMTEAIRMIQRHASEQDQIERARMEIAIYQHLKERDADTEHAAIFRWMRERHACIVRTSSEGNSPFYCMYVGGRSLITMGPASDTYEAAIRAAMEQK